jgi:uncharacterized protein (DUF58 family)
LLSRKGYTFTAAALALIGAGVFTDLDLVLLATVPIVSYMVLERLFSNPPHCNITIRRVKSAERIIQGGSVSCTVYLRNNGPQLDYLEVQDVIPPEFDVVEGSNRFVLSLQSGQDAYFTYTFEASSTGLFSLGPVIIKAADGSGFFEEVKIQEMQDQIRVLPKVEEVRARLSLIKLRNWPGEMASKKPGSGLDYHSIREFYQGDALKRVNWKAYARLQKLFTNQYSAELAGEVMIVLDARKQQIEETSHNSLDRSASLAATIALALLRERNRVGLMVMGDILEKVYPATGRRQLDKILLLLSSFTPGSRWKLSMVAHYLRLLFSRITDVIIVTALPDQQVITAAATLRNQGYSVTVMISFPKYEPDPRAEEDVNRLASRILSLQREMAVNEIRKYAKVIKVDGDQPVSVALQERSNRISGIRTIRR